MKKKRCINILFIKLMYKSCTTGLKINHTFIFKHFYCYLIKNKVKIHKINTYLLT